MGQNMHVNMGVFTETVTFNILADLSQWITQQHGVAMLHHAILQQFLIVGVPWSKCMSNKS